VTSVTSVVSEGLTLPQWVLYEASGRLEEDEREVLVRGYVTDEAVRFDMISCEPEAGIVETLLERGLLRSSVQRSGFYENFPLTRKGKELVSRLLEIERLF
jgi:hypothetical protein